MPDCKPEPISGYIVYKEYIPQHMSNRTPAVQHEAAFVYVAPARPTPPHKVQSTWAIWVGNRNGVEQISIDSNLYGRVKCGQHIKIYKH